jgi:hypothetical protein
VNAREFLELLLPSTGFIFTATPLGRGWGNTSHTSIDRAVAHTNALTFSGYPAYFALATYEKDRVWDAAWKNAEGLVVGKWVQRTQANAQSIKSFFLDLDVDPSDPNKFNSKAEALTELRAFVKRVGLPRPMLVDSGGGIHAYWPLAQAVTTQQWRPVADQFKAICLAEKFRADRSLTSDQARVLRVLGGYNFRRGMPVTLLSPGAPIGFADFQQRLDAFSPSTLPTRGPAAAALPAIPGKPVDPFESGNLGASNDPLNLDRITFHCAQLQVQVANRGATTGEQLWRAALGLAKFSEPQVAAYRAVSDGHPDFTDAATLQKMANWHTGPTTCEHFNQLNPSLCASCPHQGKITSPAQLGRTVIEAPPPKVTVVSDSGALEVMALPDPPKGYSRRKSDNAIVMAIEDADGGIEYQTICPYDLYPLALRAQSGVDTNIDERSQWRVHLPMQRGKGREARDIDVPLGMLSDTRALAKHLFSKGVILSGDQPKTTQHYMSAYLQKLADESGREKLYERLGWHDDHHTFVLGDRVIRRDGKVQLHVPSQQIRNTTRGGLKPAGTLEGWQRAMQFYNRPGYEGHRFFVYAALGAPIFHMNDTGNKGVLLTASGQSGRGKTTCLKACGSIWGHPEAMIMNGNKDGSTVNALYSAIGTTHSLPFMWDDITERDPDELRRFLLNISQGQGKRRMTSEARQSDHADTWETIVLATANTDDISRILSSGRDVNPHLMRMVGVEFSAIDMGVEAKIVADQFLRDMNANYGHAGPAMMKILVTRYEAIRNGYIKNVAMVDRLLGSANASAERYWSATVAAAYTGAQLASKMGLIDFPIDTDLQWMIDHLGKQRESIKESSSSPLEQLTAFLNGAIRHTLILSAKAASNLDNVVHKPVDDLLVRNELDYNIVYVARTAMMKYCADNRVAFKQFESYLEREGVVLQRNAQKTLGADTVYAAGQSRCWKVDASRLSGVVLPAAVTAAITPPSNVVSIGGMRR